jgi:hypothetical protein
MKTPEYREGPEALEDFKRLATAILQAPAKKKKRQTEKSASGRYPKLCKLGPDLLKPF